MSHFEDVQRAAGVLAKQGKAFIDITLVQHADDEYFRENPPSCRVTITARDPQDPTAIPKKVTADIPTNQPPYTYRFVIPVQSTIKSIAGFFGFRRKRPLELDILVEPINGFEANYEPDASIVGISVQPGDTVARNVSLKPRPDRTDRKYVIRK